MALAKTYKDLHAWQLAVEIAKQAYTISAQLPTDERYGLAAQMKRASTSLSANIAEGFCRQSQKEFRKFLWVALGSAAELESHCALCRALFNGTSPDTQRLEEDLDHFQRMVNRLARSLCSSGRSAT